MVHLWYHTAQYFVGEHLGYPEKKLAVSSTAGGLNISHPTVLHNRPSRMHFSSLHFWAWEIIRSARVLYIN